uniref:Uncharacterized protein n=1 Tax=Arundo donax TaxID=35708 RepID=A0A0A9H5Z4_ARUDO
MRALVACAAAPIDSLGTNNWRISWSRCGFSGAWGLGFGKRSAWFAQQQ